MTVDISRLATMNASLLKEMALEDVLALHPLLDGVAFPYSKAQKTKPIKAKPIKTILSDNGVMAKLLLATLEANETIKANAFVCWGIDNDVWQQSGDKLHSKYTLMKLDEDGWGHFEPKPDSPVDAYQVTASSHVLGPHGGFSIINPSWGDERILHGKQVYLQYGVDGDWVLRGLNDEKDTYRVANRFFGNTYDLMAKE